MNDDFCHINNFHIYIYIYISCHAANIDSRDSLLIGAADNTDCISAER